MAERQQDVSWGPPCGRCEHAQLVHRGPKHDGPCASLWCAIDLVRGWSTTSRCEGYVGADAQTPPPSILPSATAMTSRPLAARKTPREENGVDDDPPIPDDDQDTPYARVREGGPA